MVCATILRATGHWASQVLIALLDYFCTLLTEMHCMELLIVAISFNSLRKIIDIMRKLKQDKKTLTKVQKFHENFYWPLPSFSMTVIKMSTCALGNLSCMKAKQAGNNIIVLRNGKINCSIAPLIGTNLSKG